MLLEIKQALIDTQREALLPNIANYILNRIEVLGMLPPLKSSSNHPHEYNEYYNFLKNRKWEPETKANKYDTAVFNWKFNNDNSTFNELLLDLIEETDEFTITALENSFPEMVKAWRNWKLAECPEKYFKELGFDL